jgi:hemerythrin-like domain-containing protein
LQQFAKEGWVHRAEWQSVATFLVHDRALHHLDEEEDLFPALRRRSMLEDSLEPLLVRLKKDHRRSDILVERIVALLSEHADSDPFPISKAEAELIAAYATSELRHLAIENGVLLAIAQIRLNRKDLQKMSEAMKMRRGIQA